MLRRQSEPSPSERELFAIPQLECRGRSFLETWIRGFRKGSEIRLIRDGGFVKLSAMGPPLRGERRHRPRHATDRLPTEFLPFRPREP